MVFVTEISGVRVIEKKEKRRLRMFWCLLVVFQVGVVFVEDHFPHGQDSFLG